MATKLKLKPLPNKEALEYWKDKVQLGAGQFSGLSDAAKLKGFAVSGIAKGAELESVFNGLSKALEEGTPFEEWKRSLADVWEKRGWTGKRAWRVDNIFRTNIQTAYHVGRYKQMMKASASRAFWIYDAINDSRTRPAHRAIDGKIYRFDHPFWDTWYPPNGFRCRCGVSTLSESEMERDGLKVETDDITGTLVEPTTPDGIKMPGRLLMPDPGFSNHPGKTVWGGIVDGALADESLYKPLSGLKKAADYRRAKLKNIRAKDLPDIDEAVLLESGLPDEEYLAAFKQLYGDEMVVADAVGEPVILSVRSFLVDKRPGAEPEWKFSKSGHAEIIPILRDVVENPYEVWLTPQQNESGKVRLSKRYIGFWKTEDKKRIGGLASFEVTDGVFQGVTAFVPISHRKPNLTYLERQREGLLLYPGRKKK